MRTGGYHIFQTIMYMWGWVKTYYTIFWGNERPFTTYFNVHQGTWVLISSHVTGSQPHATDWDAHPMAPNFRGPKNGLATRGLSNIAWSMSTLLSPGGFRGSCEHHPYPLVI